MPEREKNLPAISDSEWRVMKVLWERNPLTAREVVDALAPATTWKPKTIHTLLARLVKKGAVATSRPAREYLFKPTVAEAECQREESRSFLDRVFDGEVAPFLACFVREKRLSKSEVEEIKRILDGKVKG
jgi:BlaI family penicillinase repressor